MHPLSILQPVNHRVLINIHRLSQRHVINIFQCMYFENTCLWFSFTQILWNIILSWVDKLSERKCVLWWTFNWDAPRPGHASKGYFDAVNTRRSLSSCSLIVWLRYGIIKLFIFPNFSGCCWDFLYKLHREETIFGHGYSRLKYTHAYETPPPIHKYQPTSLRLPSMVILQF